MPPNDFAQGPELPAAGWKRREQMEADFASAVARQFTPSLDDSIRRPPSAIRHSRRPPGSANDGSAAARLCRARRARSVMAVPGTAVARSSYRLFTVRLPQPQHVGRVDRSK